MSSVNKGKMRCGAAAVAHGQALLRVSDVRQRKLLEAGVSSVDLYAVANQINMGSQDMTIDTGMSIEIGQMMEIAGINMGQMDSVEMRNELVSIADTLKPVEQMIYSDAIVRALSDNLDYDTRVEVGEHFTAIEAVKDHETMVILVDGPDIFADQIGLSGTTCVQKQEEFKKALAEEGVEMDLKLMKHLDPHGGDYADVIKAAGQMHSGSLAKGIIEYVKMKPDKNPMKPIKPGLKKQPAGKRLVSV